MILSGDRSHPRWRRRRNSFQTIEMIHVKMETIKTYMIISKNSRIFSFRFKTEYLVRQK